MVLKVYCWLTIKQKLSWLHAGQLHNGGRVVFADLTKQVRLMVIALRSIGSSSQRGHPAIEKTMYEACYNGSRANLVRHFDVAALACSVAPPLRLRSPICCGQALPRMGAFLVSAKPDSMFGYPVRTCVMAVAMTLPRINKKNWSS
jgi:hypothetical protein